MARPGNRPEERTPHEPFKAGTSDGEVCKSSTIGTYFTPAKKDDEAKSLRITNKFMNDRSFVRAYVDKDKDIVVETDIAFSGGIRTTTRTCSTPSRTTSS